MNLEKRIECARRDHAEGQNCAQCVVRAFNDVTGLPEDVASRLACGLGGGVGRTGEICGVLSGIAVVEGFMHPNAPASKPIVAKRVAELCNKFRDENGAVRCCELKGRPGAKPCMQLIEDGIALLHKSIEEDA